MGKLKKPILGILLTIFLGAIGSGFWEICLKDIFIWIGHAILRVITLGITSVRDSFYEEIAKGRTDRAALNLHLYVIMFLGGICGFIFSRRAPQTDDENRTEERKAWRKAIFSLLPLVFFCFFRLTTLTYVSGAVDQYEQSYTICLPYLSEKEREQIRSQFAQIRTKEDYKEVLSKLVSVASTNKIKVPDFSIW